MIPAFTALAASTLPPARLATASASRPPFRQIGAALGLASFVAIVGGSTLATKSDFDGAWLFMAIAAAGAGIVLTPLFHRQPQAVRRDHLYPTSNRQPGEIASTRKES